MCYVGTHHGIALYNNNNKQKQKKVNILFRRLRKQRSLVPCLSIAPVAVVYGDDEFIYVTQKHFYHILFSQSLLVVNNYYINIKR